MAVVVLEENLQNLINEILDNPVQEVYSFNNNTFLGFCSGRLYNEKFNQYHNPIVKATMPNSHKIKEEMSRLLKINKQYTHLVYVYYSKQKNLFRIGETGVGFEERDKEHKNTIWYEKMDEVLLIAVSDLQEAKTLEATLSSKLNNNYKVENIERLTVEVASRYTVLETREADLRWVNLVANSVMESALQVPVQNSVISAENDYVNAADEEGISVESNIMLTMTTEFNFKSLNTNKLYSAKIKEVGIGEYLFAKGSYIKIGNFSKHVSNVARNNAKILEKYAEPVISDLGVMKLKESVLVKDSTRSSVVNAVLRSNNNGNSKKWTEAV